MSYTKDLDEYTGQELHDELAMREAERAKGLCDYCHRPLNTSPCKFPERHKKN